MLHELRHRRHIVAPLLGDLVQDLRAHVQRTRDEAREVQGHRFRESLERRTHRATEEEVNDGCGPEQKGWPRQLR